MYSPAERQDDVVTAKKVSQEEPMCHSADIVYLTASERNKYSVSDIVGCSPAGLEMLRADGAPLRCEGQSQEPTKQ